VLHAAPDLAPIHACEREREGQILAHRHVRIERIALKDHRHVAIACIDLVRALAVDANLAAARRVEPDDEVQERRLPAARRAHEDEELAVANREARFVHGVRAVRETFADAVEDDLRHAALPLYCAGGQPRDDAPLEE
jgi:hypothetical protein